MEIVFELSRVSDCETTFSKQKQAAMSDKVDVVMTDAAPAAPEPAPVDPPVEQQPPVEEKPVEEKPVEKPAETPAEKPAETPAAEPVLPDKVATLEEIATVAAASI